MDEITLACKHMDVHMRKCAHHTHTHPRSIHIHRSTYIHAYIHTCMHTCIHAHMHTCMHAYIHENNVITQHTIRNVAIVITAQKIYSTSCLHAATFQQAFTYQYVTMT